MKIFTTENIKKWSGKLFLPWLAIYIFIMGGTGVLAASMYQKYEEYRLPSGKIELSVGKTRYQLNETVGFTVTNNFSVPIFVTNNCPKEPLDVYEWKNEKWVQLHDSAKDDSECYSEERNVEIPAGGTRSYNFEDWPHLFSKPGVYRIATEIDHYDDILFQDFAVLEPAKITEVKTFENTVPKQSITPIPLTTEPEIKIYPEEPEDEEDYQEREMEYQEREYEGEEEEDD